MKRLVLSVVLILSVGCSSAQLQKDEAILNAGLVKLEAGINWANAHPDLIAAAFEAAVQLDLNNQTLQALHDKGLAALQAGDFVLAQNYLHAMVLFTAPAPAAQPK